MEAKNIIQLLIAIAIGYGILFLSMWLFRDKKNNSKK